MLFWTTASSELHGVDISLVLVSTIPEFHHHPRMIWPSRIPGISWFCLRSSLFSQGLGWPLHKLHFVGLESRCCSLSGVFGAETAISRAVPLHQAAPSLQGSWEKQTDPGSLVCNKKARPRATDQHLPTVSQGPSGSCSWAESSPSWLLGDPFQRQSAVFFHVSLLQGVGDHFSWAACRFLPFFPFSTAPTPTRARVSTPFFQTASGRTNPNLTQLNPGCWRGLHVQHVLAPSWNRGHLIELLLFLLLSPNYSITDSEASRSVMLDLLVSDSPPPTSELVAVWWCDL